MSTKWSYLILVVFLQLIQSESDCFLYWIVHSQGPEPFKPKSAEVSRSASMPKKVQVDAEKPSGSNLKRVESTPASGKSKRK